MASIIDAIIRAESGGNPRAVSPMGAMGLMQIMPATARSPGFGVSPLKDPFDPDENKRFGTEYFNAMLKRYGGDQRKALVAYNWGPGNADKWNGDLSKLPKETREYVTRIEGFQGGAQSTYKPSGGGNVKRYQPEPLNQMQGVLAPGLRERPRGLLDVPPEPRSAPQSGESFFTQDNVGSILDGLAGAFNTLRWRPDPAVSRGIELRGARREQSKRQNKTAEYLREAGAGQLAGLVETGALSARDAIGFLAAPEDQRTSLIKNFEYFVAQGMAPDEAIKAVRGGTQINVNPNAGLETAYDKERGKQLATQIGGIDTNAAAARKTLNGLSILEKLMGSEGFYSGAGGEAINDIRRVGRAIGLDVEGVDSAEAFSAVAKMAALDSMGGSLGAGFSNADRDFVTGQVPGLSNTPEGNKKLIEIQRKLAQRQIEIARRARTYEKKYGRLDVGFFNDLEVWADENDLFSDQIDANDPLGLGRL